MANEHSRSRGRTRRASAATRRDDLADWRRLTRPVIVENFLNRTRDLRWSRELIDLLQKESYVSYIRVKFEADDVPVFRKRPNWLSQKKKRMPDTLRLPKMSFSGCRSNCW